MSIATLIFENPIQGLLLAGSIVVAIGLHEAAHAYTAYVLGDITPKYQKRLSLNPFVHLDLVGFLLILFIGIGWGKPVIFNPLNLKNPKRDIALIAIAGPLTNVLLAIIATYLLVLFKAFNFQYELFYGILLLFINVNLMLAIFNMLPFEPLDGFKVLSGLLPSDLSHQLQEIKQYTMYALFFFLLTGFIGRLISPVISFFMQMLLRFV